MVTTEIYIPSQNIVQTTAEWASDTTVYSDKHVLWVSDLFYTTTDQMQFKKADGVQTFANLDFMPIGGGGGASLVAYQFFNVSNTALADGITYHLGNMTGLITGLNGFARIPLPAGTIKKAYLQSYNASTFGSSESITINILSNNGATSDLLSNTFKANARHYYEEKTLNISVVAESCYIDIVVPTMVTNPAACQLRFVIFIEPS